MNPLVVVGIPPLLIILGMILNSLDPQVRPAAEFSGTGSGEAVGG